MQAAPAPDLRALQQTLPLNDPTAQSVKAAVAEYLAQNPVKPPEAPEPRPRSSFGGPFQPTAGPAAAPVDPAPFDQGPLGTVVAMDAIQEPPRPRPAAGAAAQAYAPEQGFQPSGAGGYPPLAPPQEASAAPLGPPPAAPAEAIALDGNPPIGVAAPVDALPQAQRAEEAPREGWGVFGVLMVLLSLAAGVGLGFGLYRWAPF